MTPQSQIITQNNTQDTTQGYSQKNRDRPDEEERNPFDPDQEQLNEIPVEEGPEINDPTDIEDDFNPGPDGPEGEFDPFESPLPALIDYSRVVWVWKGNRLLWSLAGKRPTPTENLERMRMLIEATLNQMADSSYFDTIDPSCLVEVFLNKWLPGTPKDYLKWKLLLIPGDPPRLMALTAFLGSGKGKKAGNSPPKWIERKWLYSRLSRPKRKNEAEIFAGDRNLKNKEWQWLRREYKDYIDNFNKYIKAAYEGYGLEKSIPEKIEDKNEFFQGVEESSIKNRMTEWRKWWRDEYNT